MPGSHPALSVMFSFEIVVHPLTFKASELLMWEVNSCTGNTEAFFGTSTAAQYSNTWYYLCSIPLVHFNFLVEEILAFHRNVIQFFYRSILPGALYYYNKQLLAEVEAQCRQQHCLSSFFDQRIGMRDLMHASLSSGQFLSIH